MKFSDSYEKFVVYEKEKTYKEKSSIFFITGHWETGTGNQGRSREVMDILCFSSVISGERIICDGVLHWRRQSGGLTKGFLEL